MWLDLTADGDVFVPDRRFGRSRRLIDGSSPPFAYVAPDHSRSLFRSLSLCLSLFSSCLVSSRLVSVPVSVFLRSSLLGSRASRVISRPSFFLLRPPSYLLLPSSTSGLDSPVTHSQSVLRSEKALRAPPFIVRVFAGPPINRLAARCPRPRSAPAALSRASRALVIAFKVDQPNEAQPKIRPLSLFLSPPPSHFFIARDIDPSFDFPPIQLRLTTTTTTTTATIASPLLPQSNW